MRLIYFSNGGYVIHRVLGQRISAWFDEDGKLKDIERINARGQSRKPAKATRELVAKVYGNRHNFKDWNAPHCENKK